MRRYDAPGKSLVTQMTEHIPFGKIGQLKNTLYLLAKHNLTGSYVFEGTVKLHGTNAAVQLLPDGSLAAQSRKRVLSVGSDNYGFAADVAANPELYKKFIQSYGTQEPFPHVFGEWVGPGVQSGVALADLLTKRFVPFDSLPVIALVTLDITKPVVLEDAQAHIYAATMSVEDKCPYAAQYGISGIGEGLVWKCPNLSPEFWFKSKGQKHTSSKVKVQKPPSLTVEEIGSLSAFVEFACSEERMAQGVRELGELNYQNISPFIQWMQRDILAECSLEIAELKVPYEKAVKLINKTAATYYRGLCDK